MANQIYNYSSGHGGTSISTYSSRFNTAADPYQYDPSTMGSSRYLSSPSGSFPLLERSSSSLLYLNQGDGLRLRGGEGRSGVAAAASSLYPQTPWGGMDGFGAASIAESMVVPGIKRHTDALYHQSVLGTNNIIGQSDTLFSANTLVKRPRFETASHLPIYPQRPGEKDCSHYMLTRTCKFGDTCKFDHPIWVPEGGIPDWKEVPLIPSAEYLPERPREPDCPYFLKTQKCKFGNKCKFNHPRNKLTEAADSSLLPERPSEPICAFYAKTRKCKFGANCIYHHPKDLQVPSSGKDPDSEQNELANDGAASGGPAAVKTSVSPALLHNSKGLPIRLGEQDCPFYLKTGSCKYGATCRYNHPDWNSISPLVASTVGHSIFQTPGIVNPAASLLPNIESCFPQTALGVGAIMYPQRPGEIECDFYMKTGQCKFGEKCKFHHPFDRSAPTISMAKQSFQQNVKLTLAGLPRREGSIICPFYMKTGTCKFGATCRYDHPPPGEVMAMAAGQSSGIPADSVELKNVVATTSH